MMLGSKVSRFIKGRYIVAQQDGVKDPVLVNSSMEEPEIEQDSVLKEYDGSKSGRTFGWWVCIDGRRVATLEYRCFLEAAVHLYSVNVLDDKFLTIDLDPEKWLGSSVTVQSRYAEAYIKQGLSMASVG